MKRRTLLQGLIGLALWPFAKRVPAGEPVWIDVGGPMFFAGDRMCNPSTGETYVVTGINERGDICVGRIDL